MPLAARQSVQPARQNRSASAPRARRTSHDGRRDANRRMCTLVVCAADPSEEYGESFFLRVTQRRTSPGAPAASRDEAADTRAPRPLPCRTITNPLGGIARPSWLSVPEQRSIRGWAAHISTHTRNGQRRVHLHTRLRQARGRSAPAVLPRLRQLASALCQRTLPAHSATTLSACKADRKL